MTYLEIKPNSKIKKYFWSDPYRLPKKEEDLIYFEKNNIQFVIALGTHTMKPKLYDKIKNLIDHHIGINICLLDKDYAHLDNSQNFKNLYEEIKKSKIFEDINEIYIDAEIASKYRKKINSLPFNKKLPFIISSYPKKNEYRNAITDLNLLIDLIHDDRKKFGIIRSQKAAYEIEKLTRNIPFKEINPDLEVIMIYRVPEGKNKAYSDFWFYQNAKREGHNIFVGDIKDGYRNLREDITICSYLKKKRIYIYDYYGFQKYCNLSDLKLLKKYKIRYNILDSVKHGTKIAGMEIADKFLKFLK